MEGLWLLGLSGSAWFRVVGIRLSLLHKAGKAPHSVGFRGSGVELLRFTYTA